MELFPIDLVTRERHVVGTAAFQGGPVADREFSVTARGFANETLDPELLITSRIDLNNIVDSGFDRLLDRETNEMKILVRP